MRGRPAPEGGGTGADRAKTVALAADVLRSVARQGAAGTTELASRLGVNRTVVHRLAATLTDAGLLRHHGRTWSLGLGLLELAASVAGDLRRAARTPMEDLAQRFDATVVLSLPDGDDVVAVEQVEPVRATVRMAYRAGMRHTQRLGAHGRALLAFAPDDRRTRLLAEAPDRDRLAAQLDEVVATGVAHSRDELEVGAGGFAVPVRDHRGTVVASLGIVTPAARLPDRTLAAPALTDAATRITTALA